MSGTMARADLVADLKASLHDAASVFTAAADADFVRHTDKAALDMHRVRPLVKSGTITLVAGTSSYSAPADLLDIDSEQWSTSDRMPFPWESNWPGRLPLQRVIGAAGAKQIVFSPAPTAMQVAVLGATFAYCYRAAHAIGDTTAATTIAAGDRGLLLLRAQAEAMRELAMRNVGKPVQMRDGITGQPRNGTPAALYTALLAEFLGGVPT